MRINFYGNPQYRIWRNGTNKKAGSFGKPGSKLAKKMIRNRIKDQFRKQRLQNNKGKAD